MSIVRILQYPDFSLKKPGKWVEKVDDEVRKVVADMFETHYSAKNCAALGGDSTGFCRSIAHHGD